MAETLRNYAPLNDDDSKDFLKFAANRNRYLYARLEKTLQLSGDQSNMLLYIGNQVMLGKKLELSGNQKNMFLDIGNQVNDLVRKILQSELALELCGSPILMRVDIRNQVMKLLKKSKLNQLKLRIKRMKILRCQFDSLFGTLIKPVKISNIMKKRMK